MTTEPQSETVWDETPHHENELSHEEIMYFIEHNDSCVVARLRKDGHPIAAVVGGGLMDGQIYAITNTFRMAYRAIQRDNRVCVVYDIPMKGSVSVIGRAEIVDDIELVRRLFALRAPTAPVVVQGFVTIEQFMELAVTPNRRLLRIHPDKFLVTDLRKVSTFDDDDTEEEPSKQ